MTVVKEREWRTKFNQLPLLLKIVVLWIYFISIGNFLKFFIVLVTQLSLNPFALAFGYLIWELASGLVKRSNIARMVALSGFGFSSAITIYVLWNGGNVSVDDLNLSTSYLGSIFWIVASCISIVILLLPQVRKIFSTPSYKEKTE